MSVAGLALSPLFASDPDGLMWAAKGVTSPFMGAAFVAGAMWATPSHRPKVAVVATAAVVIWACVLTVGAGTWGAVLGALGVAGALATARLVRTR